MINRMSVVFVPRIYKFNNYSIFAHMAGYSVPKPVYFRTHLTALRRTNMMSFLLISPGFAREK